MLNPINHARTAADVDRYKAEPYVVAGDVYARPPHAGRGGWSWYTGSAAWMYRAGLESMLGLAAARRHVQRRPLHPLVVARVRDHLAVPEHALPRSRSSTPLISAAACSRRPLDGAVTDVAAIPLVDDGRTHEVRILIGSASQESTTS